ncbi:MAG: hypothetical protein ACFCVG_11085 [Kineosporiaceae bacterium]
MPSPTTPPTSPPTSPPISPPTSPTATAAAPLADILDAVADTLVPPEGDWPAPSALGVGPDLAGHLRPEHLEQLADAAATLPPDFAEASPDARTDVLRRVEATDPAAFDLLRRACYLGYYARPEVVAVLRARGHDIAESPQPHGYAITPVDLAAVPQSGRGRYLPTSGIAAAGVAGTGRPS